MESPVTIVTSLFYLAREKWKYSGFPPNYDRYLSWSENSLSLDTNFVIFVDDHYYNHIESTRKKYDPEFAKTKIYRVDLTKLGFYEKFFFKMAKLMSSPQFTKKRNSEGAEVFYPSYNIIQYNKIDLLKKVKDENPFNSNYLMWMDIGATRDNLEKYKGKKFPTNFEHFNDKIVHFSHNTDFRIHHKQEYFMSQVRNIHGGYFIIPNEKADIYYDLICNELNSIIEDGFIGSDEKCYDSVYLNNPEHFQLVKSGWFEFYNILSKENNSHVS
jgi:hypothetical protein